MRSNNRRRQGFETVLWILQKAKSVFSLGIESKQWLLCVLICAMLLPMFSLPASAFVYPVNATNSGEFEPVNEKLPIWTETWRSLNAKIESWTTPIRSGNDLIGDNEDDKKKAKKKEKEVKSEETIVENALAEKETDKMESNKITEPASKNEKADKKISKSKVEKNIPVNTGSKNITTPPTASLLLNQLPDDERGSVYRYENNLGTPPGQVEKDSPNQAAALSIRHRAGIANFSFDVPLASLSGRGIDARVGLIYNSRAWNKSCVNYDTQGCSQNHFTYDVEQSWIAPGFSSGFGYFSSKYLTRSVIMMNGSNTVFKTLTEVIPDGITDVDGTRHEIQCKTYSQIPGGHFSAQYCTAFETTDGSFIKIVRNGIPNYAIGTATVNYSNYSFTVYYPNGSRVYYSTPFGSGNNRKHYPYLLQDRNGNRVSITYKTDQSGRIDHITDTLNRQIKFYYENDSTTGNPDKLVAITIPGMGTNEEIQTVRFYYDELTLQSGGFVSTAEVTAPSTIGVLKYVFMPATKTGYKYEYHPKYGMIKKITRQVGMSGSTLETNTTGTLTEGIFAASTEYDYTDGSTPQNEVPKYTKRTDDWQGRTSTNLQETLYDVPEPTSEGYISRITVKDNGFDVLTESISNSGGLLKETSIKKIFGPSGQYSKLMSKSEYTWTGSRNLTNIKSTNEAGLTKKTDFEYDQYNNRTKVKEYDYGTSNPTLLRTTEIEYETGSGWINNNLLSLPKSIKKIVGGAVVSKTLYEYDHGGDDSTLTKYSDILNYDPAYNPLNPPRNCTRVCDSEAVPSGYTKVGEDEEENNVMCATYCTGSYLSSTAYRGNVTKVTAFSDAALTTDTNADINNYEYDIAGNLVSATLSCCNLKTIDYGATFSVTGYAYPVKETKGALPTQLVTEAVYNYNTGLTTSSKDENAQVTAYEYEADTLRPKKTTYPNGGYVQTEYSDKLVTSVSNLLPAFIRTTATLDTTKTTQSYTYFNGGGQSIRGASQTPDGWKVSAVEFDKLGRLVKSYNPFYASTPTGTIPSNTKHTEVLGYDALGRTTSVQLQDNTTVLTEFGDTTTTPSGFAKTFVTVTDQAGKQKRQVADALGRIVRVDEPNSSGILGAVDAPNQPTNYEYDGNNNLKKVTQSDGTVTQERIFKYDSLSRLTHERQVEAIPTLTDAGVKVSSGGLWTKVLKYDSHGLLTDGYDANGVNTHFTYDTLNRVDLVEFFGEVGYKTPNVDYTYDEEHSGFYNKGKLTKVTTAAVTGTQGTPATEQIYDFDKMGRVIKHQQKIDSQSYLLEYGYNLAGQLVSEKYPSGRIVTAEYDGNGRLSSVADAQRIYLSSISFSGKTLPSQMNFGNGTNQIFDFNDRLQMKNQTLSKGSEILQKYDYGFGQIDAAGNLDTSKNNGQLAKIESYIGTNKQWTQKFSYDSIGRLSESKEYRGDTNALSYKQKFDFDRFGNLYRKNASNPISGQGNPLSYTTIEDSDIDKNTNRFTSGTGTTYNNAGEVIADNKFRLMNFSYDANGRMVKSTRASVPDALSVYDGTGNRVGSKVNDVWQFTIYDAFSKIVAEYGGISGNDEGGVKYIFLDWLGSVRAVLNNAGFIESRTDYQAFGEEIQSGIGLRTTTQGFGGGANTRQGYGLTESDIATGLNHTWFRKNETRAGRWTSPDPYNGSLNIGNPQSFNRYSYVENQPTNSVDPSGLLIWHCRTVDYQYWDPHFRNDDGTMGQWGVGQRTECTMTNIGGGSPGPSGGDPGSAGGGSPGGNLQLLQIPTQEIDPKLKACLERVTKESHDRLAKWLSDYPWTEGFSSLHDVKNTIYSAIGSTLVGVVTAAIGFTFSEVLIAMGIAFVVSLVAVWAFNMIETLVKNLAVRAAVLTRLGLDMAACYTFSDRYSY